MPPLEQPPQPSADGARLTRGGPRRWVRAVLADTRPLSTPAFRRLWFAGIVTAVGAQLSVVAVPVQVYALTGSSSYVGLTGLFGLVPLVVFGLWGGAIADAVDRRSLLLVTATGLSLTAIALWVAAVTGAAAGAGGVWLVLALYAVQQAFLAVNQPTRGAVLPRLLPPDQLPAANALTMLVFTTGAIVGPLLAGALIPLIGLGPLYMVDAVTLTATLWATWRLPHMPPTAPSASSAPSDGDSRRRVVGLRDVIDGFAFAARHKVLLVSFLVDIIAMGVGLPRAVFPEAAVHTFGDPPSGGPALGWLYAAMAIGAAAGALFSGWLHRVHRQGAAVTAAICVWGLAVAAFGIVHALWLAVVFLAIGGAADTVSAVYRSTMLQVVATDEMRGRMQGVFIVVVVGGPRLADLWHGPAAAGFGTSTAATAGGLGVVVLTLLVVAYYREFWRYRAA